MIEKGGGKMIRSSESMSEPRKEEQILEERLQQMKKAYQEVEMTEEQLQQLKDKMQKAKTEEGQHNAHAGKHKTKRLQWIAAVLAGMLILLPNTSATAAYAMGQIPLIGSLVELVTFRDYAYDSERHTADIEISGIAITGELTDKEAQKQLEQTTKEINAEIERITDDLIQEFESSLEEDGYQDVVVKSEVLAATPEYFTLKLLCYQGAGSGYQWNYYYTIDLATGERLHLKDLFEDGADYITPISTSIKTQMQTQMQEDENCVYWLDGEVEEWNFQSITEDTSFYINENGNIVIGFDEGDVAPMYMGAVEFEIPNEVVESIRK